LGVLHGFRGGAYWRLSGVILAKAGIYECMDSRVRGNDGEGA
jgi:hypothetical protein